MNGQKNLLFYWLPTCINLYSLQEFDFNYLLRNRINPENYDIQHDLRVTYEQE